MALAFRFGRPDVDLFMREMGSRQLVEWEKFLELQANPPPKMVSPAVFRDLILAKTPKQKKG